MRSLLTVLILLSNSSTLLAATTPKVYAFPAPAVRPILDDAQSLPPKISAEEALRRIGQLGSTTRWVNSGKGDAVWIYCFSRFVQGQKVHVTFSEAPRATLLSQQFADLARIAEKISGLQEKENTPPIIITRSYYSLKLPRATFTVDASFDEIKDELNPEPTEVPKWIVVLDLTGGSADTNATSATISITTGPREAWSISAAVPISTLSELQVSSDAKTLDLRNKPSTFYASLDFLPTGDAIQVPDRIDKAFAVKVLLKASVRPIDSFALGVGLRPGFFGQYLSYSILQILDTVSPFMAVARTRDTASVTTGPAQGAKVRFVRYDFLVGLSFDIKKAVDWAQNQTAVKQVK